MSSPELAVLLYGRRVAALRQDRNGRHELEYADDPGQTPLSLSLPLEQTHHGHRIVNAFLSGLVPDDRAVRAQIGNQFGVSGENPYALLEHIGLDCAGAVQFCPPEQVEEVLARPGELRPVDENQIAERLKQLRRTPSATWTLPQERWSLGGFQPKIALRRIGSGWAEAIGAEPTSHIFKPGIPALQQSALNEHICLSAARRLGLRAVESRYMEFNGEPAIVVTRYDRAVGPEGEVVRIHQEDFCQALGQTPTRKYEDHGGPSALQILNLLGQTQPEAQMEFIRYLAFNYLIGAPDSHAKNFSILHVGSDIRLAPMYDVASALPYDGFENARFAFSIGGQRIFGALSGDNWAQLAAKAGIDAEQTVAIVHDIAEQLPDALSDVLADPGLPSSELGVRMLPAVTRLCGNAL